MRTKILALWAAGTLGFVGTSAQAALLDADSFNYSGTALVGQNGGTGWSGAWFQTGTSANNTLSNDSVSLAYPATFQSPLVAPTPTGSRVSTGGLTGNANTSRLLSTPINLAQEGNVYYVSALIKKNRPNGETTADNILIEFVDSSANRRFGLGIEGTTDRPWLNHNGSTTAGTSVTAGDTYLLVAKVISHATANDEYFLKVYGTGYGSQVPAVEPTTWDAQNAQGTAAILDRIRVRIDNANQAGTPGEVDEIRIATDWVSVVPEPTSIAMLGIGAIGLMARRRRV